VFDFEILRKRLRNDSGDLQKGRKRPMYNETPVGTWRGKRRTGKGGEMCGRDREIIGRPPGITGDSPGGLRRVEYGILVLLVRLTV